MELKTEQETRRRSQILCLASTTATLLSLYVMTIAFVHVFGISTPRLPGDPEPNSVISKMSGSHDVPSGLIEHQPLVAAGARLHTLADGTQHWMDDSWRVRGSRAAVDLSTMHPAAARLAILNRVDFVGGRVARADRADGGFD